MLRILPVLLMSLALAANIANTANAAPVSAPDLDAEYEKTQLRFFLEAAAEAADENTPEKTVEAIARLRKVAGEYQKAPVPSVADSNTFNPHSRRNPRALARHDFFVWRFLFCAAHTLAARGELPEDVRAGIEPIARENIRPRERAPNNRSFHFALGAIYAADLFPKTPDAATWRAYANAVFDDWLTLGDAVEPGYVGPWFPPLLELGVALHREPDLRGPVARVMYARMRDHISASGLACTPGDPGGSADQTGYIEGLARAAELTNDGSLLGAAQRALAATSRADKNYAKLARFVKNAGAALAKNNVRATPAQPLAEIQPLFGASPHAVPDRMILSNPASPAQPYAGFFIMDRTETYHHGHEDTRGEIYHYESGGVMLLRRPGWIKWSGCANTFIVADATAQFPFSTTRGLTPDRWLSASAWIPPIRDIVEDAVWRRKGGEPAEYTQQAMSDTARGLGYSWINMSGYLGAHDTQELREIVLRFLAIPKKEFAAAEAAGDHSLGTLSFDPGMAWYREYRPVAPAGADGTLAFLVSNFRISGMKESQTIAAFDSLPDNMTVVHYAPGTRGKPGRIVPRSEWEKWLSLAPAACEAGGGASPAAKNALRVICPPGRLDLVFKPEPKPRNIAEEFPRIEFDYQVLTPDATLLRLPIALEINKLHPRSIYLDAQQGGRLVASAASRKNGDSYGAMTYENAWSAGALWTRRVVLTGEGVMIVVDEYKTSEKQHGVVGGPVWQLASAPIAGLNWFSAPAQDDPQKSLLVYFHPQQGVEYGMQFQPKLFVEQNYAVFAKGMLRPGETRRFVTVLVPHDTGLAPSAIMGSTNKNMRLFDVPRERMGIQTSVDENGKVTARIAPRDKRWPYKPVTVTLSATGEWTVVRR